MDLRKRVFYYSKTILFEVWEGSGSSLFSVVILDGCFLNMFWCFFEIYWLSGSPKGSKWVSLGDLEGPN